MLLLLVVATVLSGVVSLEPDAVQRIPNSNSNSGPSNNLEVKRNDSPFGVLFSNRLAPLEIIFGQYEQTPIPHTSPKEETFSEAINQLRTQSHQHFESHPAQNQIPFDILIKEDEHKKQFDSVPVSKIDNKSYPRSTLPILGSYEDKDKKMCDWSTNVNCKANLAVTTPISDDYKVVCYFTNWSWYRNGRGKYNPSNIDSSLCTHIIYAYAILDDDQLTIKPYDEVADIKNKLYEKVTALKSRGTKVLVSMGGWNDSEGDKYSRLVAAPDSRHKFIEHVIQFIKNNNFDGLDLDWEYPVCWQANCSSGADYDKTNFATFMKELKVAFKPHGLLLSSTATYRTEVINKGYDVPTLFEHLDWISVTAYGYHSQWGSRTGHVAPLYANSQDDDTTLNIDYTINYFIEKGANPKKLVLGMPMYGISFTLAQSNANTLNQESNGTGDTGIYSRQPGTLFYYEICYNIQNEGWTVVKDPERSMGPYAYKGNQWVSFDDTESISYKTDYIKKLGLGGAMIWSLDMDDFLNLCECESYPLLKTINRGLQNYTQPKPGCSPLQDESLDVDVRGPTNTIPGRQRRAAHDPDHIVEDDYKVVCYFTNWSANRKGEGKYLPSNIDTSLCTHIVYAFALLDDDDILIKSQDTWTDIDKGFFEKVTAHKSKGVKVSISMGGSYDSVTSQKYSSLVGSPAKRQNFTEHVIKFIQEHNFDGLDLDWQHPVCWKIELQQLNCSRGPESDKTNFAQFIKELKLAFRPHGLLLSVTIPHITEAIDKGYDVSSLTEYLDWFAVLAYNYHVEGDGQTGHVAPMYAHSQDKNPTLNINYTVHYLIKKGVDPKKLVIGIPMYGRSFTLAQNDHNSLNQRSIGGGQRGPITDLNGFLAYYEICYKIANEGWTVVRDPERSMGPYTYKGNQWISFDDADSITYKSDWVKKMGLGGAMIWSLALDDFNNQCRCESYPLLKSINRSLRNYTAPAPPCTLLGDSTPLMSESEQRTMGSLDKLKEDSTPLISEIEQRTMGSHDILKEVTDGYKVVCYFTNWAIYRQDTGKYKPSDIDPSLCTHIVYASALLDKDSLLIKSSNPLIDLHNYLYENVTALKAKGVKVSISMGELDASNKYSRLVETPDRRQRFIGNVIQFLKDNNFDGLHLEWRHPVCWDSHCNRGPESDKANFVTFIKELKTAFEPHHLLLSATVAHQFEIINKGYDVPALTKYLDWITVSTSNYHGPNETKTGHLAPLYAHSKDDNPNLNLNATIHHLLQKGADPNKLLVKMPMYGRSFTLAESYNNTINQKTIGHGKPGTFTKSSGYLAYYEICHNILNEGWTVVRDPEKSMGPYAYKGDQWVSFDDTEFIRNKAEWIKEMGLGGAVIGPIDMDDFNNLCGCERYPLLKTVNRALRNYTVPDPECLPLRGLL